MELTGIIIEETARAIKIETGISAMWISKKAIIDIMYCEYGKLTVYFQDWAIQG